MLNSRALTEHLDHAPALRQRACSTTALLTSRRGPFAAQQVLLGNTPNTRILSNTRACLRLWRQNRVAVAALPRLRIDTHTRTPMANSDLPTWRSQAQELLAQVCCAALPATAVVAAAVAELLPRMLFAVPHLWAEAALADEAAPRKLMAPCLRLVRSRYARHTDCRSVARRRSSAVSTWMLCLGIFCGGSMAL